MEDIIESIGGLIGGLIGGIVFIYMIFCTLFLTMMIVGQVKNSCPTRCNDPLHVHLEKTELGTTTLCRHPKKPELFIDKP